MKLPFEAAVYTRRRQGLRERVRSGLVLLLGNVESPINYPHNTFKFRQDSSFLYYFGLDMPQLAGIIDIDNGKDYIFGNDVSMEDIIWMGKQPSMLSLGERVGVQMDCVRPYDELKETLHEAVAGGRKVHFLPPYRGEHFLTLSKLLGLKSGRVKDYVSEDLIKAVVAMRSCKGIEEVKELKEAAGIGYEMHTTAMRMAHSGELEQHIYGTMEGIAVGYGCQTSFPTILSQNGQILHNHDHSQYLKKGRLLLVDAGAETLSHYASDNTRTIPVDGEFTDRQLHVYNTVLAGVELGVQMSRPGIPYRDVHQAVSRVLAEGLKELGVMKGDVDEAVASGAHSLFMPHGLGHMMGMDVHDMEGFGEDYVGYDESIVRSSQFGLGGLRCGRALQEGFVVTVEPGIYFIPDLIKKWRNEKINSAFLDFDELEKFYDFGGIRLEDDILVTADGCEIIVKDERIPIRPEDVCRVVQENM
ncbi:MAG: Xaa-Pro aminopeptidase [Bacteroidetes bacterium]|nr:MAG: Xaa-Pro aminopeptidase [Bacteroidota bacterium]